MAAVKKKKFGTNMNIQAELFNEIKLRVNNNILIAQLLCNILGIKSDSAYRRIRGETELTISELIKLSTYFGISLDALMHKNNVNKDFMYRRFDTDIANDYIPFLDYLSGTFKQTIYSEKREIILTAQEIPTIHTMLFDSLAMFKLFVWRRNETGNQALSYECFLQQINDYRETLLSYYKKITAAYKQIPSVEVWSDKVLDSILHLLEYHYDTNCFEDRTHILEICRQLNQLVETVELWAEQGMKITDGKSASFNIYRCPVDMQNNYTYISRNGMNTVFVKMFAINGLFADNEFIVNDTSKWIKNIISASQSLSIVSARERFCFFHDLKNKIRHLSVKIEEGTHIYT